ncbi:MAG: aspartate aminotransferase family protein, partial [Solirubrobacteraceae bacterium]
MTAGTPTGAVVSDLARRADRVMPGGELGVLSLPGARRFVADHGLGPRVWDISGKGYIDLLLGSGALILGHAPAPVVEAVQRQLARGTTYYALSGPAVALAERLV